MAGKAPPTLRDVLDKQRAGKPLTEYEAGMIEGYQRPLATDANGGISPTLKDAYDVVTDWWNGNHKNSDARAQRRAGQREGIKQQYGASQFAKMQAGNDSANDILKVAAIPPALAAAAAAAPAALPYLAPAAARVAPVAARGASAASKVARVVPKGSLAARALTGGASSTAVGAGLRATQGEGTDIGDAALDFALGAATGGLIGPGSNQYLKLSGALGGINDAAAARLLKMLGYGADEIAAMSPWIKNMLIPGAAGAMHAGPIGMVTGAAASLGKGALDYGATKIAQGMATPFLGPMIAGAIPGATHAVVDMFNTGDGTQMKPEPLPPPAKGSSGSIRMDDNGEIVAVPPSQGDVGMMPGVNVPGLPNAGGAGAMVPEADYGNPMYAQLASYIGKRESGNDYGAQSKNSSAHGKYQMLTKMLVDVGRITPEAYAKYGSRAAYHEDAYVGGRSKWLGGDGQEEDFRKGMALNEATLRDKLVGTDEDGNKVGWDDLDYGTKANILKMAWFAGPTGAIKYLHTGQQTTDANGTTTGTY